MSQVGGLAASLLMLPTLQWRPCRVASHQSLGMCCLSMGLISRMLTCGRALLADRQHVASADSVVYARASDHFMCFQPCWLGQMQVRCRCL